MSSREIAELTGKQHQHVKRDIESMLVELGRDASSFGHIYRDTMNRSQTEYLLPKDLTITLVSGYNVQMRYAFTKRWMELEAQQAPRIPQTFAEALRLAAEMEEQKETLRWRHTMSNIITRDYNGNVFQFRADGYFNMTKAAQAFGKDVRKFFITQEANDYLAALDEIVPKTAQLVETQRGRNGGTWGHPKLAVFFARWLDVKFAVFCDMVIDDILNKKAELTITKPEESMAMKVPQTFSEALRLAAELEEQPKAYSD